MQWTHIITYPPFVNAIDNCEWAGFSNACWQYPDDEETLGCDCGAVRVANAKSELDISQRLDGNDRARTVKFLKLSAAAAGSHPLDVATSAKPDATQVINNWKTVTQQSVSYVLDRLAINRKPGLCQRMWPQVSITVAYSNTRHQKRPYKLLIRPPTYGNSLVLQPQQKHSSKFSPQQLISVTISAPLIYFFLTLVRYQIFYITLHFNT